MIAPAQPGSNVQLTIDPYLQFVAERALDQEMRASHALDGTAIVMDPWSGEILAMANAPDFDPNRFWSFGDDNRRDRAVMDAYEPGSTYKLVTAAAALESHKVTLASRFVSRDEIEVGGRTIHNADDGFTAGSSGSETLGDIITYSHNVGAAEVGMAIGAKTFYSMERRAGFGEPSNLGLPGENPGIVPPPAQWSGSSLATMAFGQGVSVTPIAMARFYCAIANGGLLMQPRIVNAVYDQDGKLEKRFASRVERRIFSQRTAAELRGFLRSVVVRGTGDPTAQIKGYATGARPARRRWSSRRVSCRLLCALVHRHGSASAPALRRLREARTPDRRVLRQRNRGARIREDRARGDAARRSASERPRCSQWAVGSLAASTSCSHDCPAPPLAATLPRTSPAFQSIRVK